MGDLSKKLAELAAFWNEVEERTKATEQLRSETVIPAINELRYAGRMFVDAWSVQQKAAPTEADIASVEEKIIVARQYLINADHDAIDAALVYIYRNVKYAVKRYRKGKISAHIPDFLNKLDRIDEFEAKIRASRKNRELRNQIYQEIIPHYEEMMALHIDLDRAERHVLRGEKISTYITRILACIGLVGSIASIVGIIAAWDQIKAFITS
jgi:hypothetical protein